MSVFFADILILLYLRLFDAKLTYFEFSSSGFNLETGLILFKCVFIEDGGFLKTSMLLLFFVFPREFLTELLLTVDEVKLEVFCDFNLLMSEYFLLRRTNLIIMLKYELLFYYKIKIYH
jgi:hypothetical protein